jgi:hypothetical protein
VFNAIIKDDPGFPFAYFLRGFCQKFLNIDNNWKEDYMRARRILLITTKMPGHNPSHDAVLRQIEETH